ncbi:MAG TPA: 5'-nucleotidase C-terminal domain-containing protein [Blastocatellia bacterium]|nr:5'-nucleotidase C-terminal domain-containing protein [Blastocatellia bacterium]
MTARDTSSSLGRSRPARRTVGYSETRGSGNQFTLARLVILLLLLGVLFSGTFSVRPAAQTSADRIVRLTFLQLNDVYQMLPSDLDGSGGLARITTLKKQILSESDNLIFVLAGDTVSPSLESIVFKGQQMIDLWNILGLNIAVYGNHEFDFRADVLRQRVKESNFTWLAANVIDKRTGSPFAGAQRYIIKEIEGVKFGIFGVLTLETLHTSQPGPDIEIQDPISVGQTIVQQMRAQGAQVIIGLTHLSVDDDKKLAKAAPINLILGGHEHELIQTQSGDTPIYKMGSDARNLGRIELRVSASTGAVQSIDCKVIRVTKDVPEDTRTRAIIDEYEKQLEARLGVSLDEKIGESQVDLDAQQTSVRAKESNLGNLIADTFREWTNSDVALVNGGGIRSDRLYPAGPVTNRHVYSILPFKNKIVLIQVTGAELRQALERGVSRVVEEGEDGGFAQVSGVRFVYDGKRAPGSRIVSATVGKNKLDNKKSYKLATVSYLADGNEGYTMLKGKPDLTASGMSKFDVDLMLEKIKKTRVSPQTDGRITRRDGN